jgi:hypothetical protein
MSGKGSMVAFEICAISDVEEVSEGSKELNKAQKYLDFRQPLIFRVRKKTDVQRELGINLNHLFSA